MAISLGKGCHLGLPLVLIYFNCLCTIPIWCLGQDVKFDLSVPAHCRVMYLVSKLMTFIF